MSEQGLQRCGLRLENAVEVVGCDQGAGDLWADPADMTELSTTKAVVGRMLKTAKRTIQNDPETKKNAEKMIWKISGDCF